MHASPHGSRFNSRRAFTLIELLTVIAIIGILAAIIIPTVSKVRTTAKKAQCISRMRQFGSAIALQANDAKSKVILGYVKDGNGNHVLDPYFNSGGSTAIEVTTGKATDNKTATKAFWTCPTGINGGNSLSAAQYGFVVPIGASAPVNGVTMLSATVNRYYSLSDASSPSKLLLMVEVKNGSNNLEVKNTGEIKNVLEGSNSVRVMQQEDGYVRHGGSANALFLDGHVGGLSTVDTDYTVSQVNLDRYFTLK